MIKARGLGRGLDALLGGEEKATDRLTDLPVGQLQPGKYQPRSHMNPEALSELAASIKAQGLIQPLLVRPVGSNRYELIAGERRWRAAQRAGIHEVPVLVRELSEERAFEAALVENLVREDLNPLEAARAFQRLVDEHGHSVEDIAKLVGKDRSTVANALRILKLPETILDRIASRELSEGHARALLGAANPGALEALAREAVDKGWSVRETERRARTVAQEAKDAKKNGAAPKSANVRDVEEQLTRKLGTSVTLADRKGKGQLAIRFTSYDELDRLIQMLLG